MPDLSQAIPATSLGRSKTTVMTSRVTSSRDSTVPSKTEFTTERVARNRLSAVGTQGTLQRTSSTARRASSAATNAETKPISTSSYQPLQRRIPTRLTATESKPIARIQRASLGSQEASINDSATRRTSFLAKRTVTTTNPSNSRSKRTPLVARRSSIEVRSMSTPVRMNKNLSENENAVFSNDGSSQPPISSESEPVKPISLTSITTPRRGTPKRQARSTVRKNRRGSFIEGIKNNLPTNDLEIQSNKESSCDSVQQVLESPSEVPVEVNQLAPEPVEVTQASLNLHAPTSNERKRKAPEELAMTFKKITRNAYMANTIFLSDMPLHVSRSQIDSLIREVFVEYLNDISEIKIMSSAKKRSSGIAYVIFKSKEAAIRAKDVNPKGDMKIFLMGSPEHMNGALDTSLDPASKEYARNVTIERLLSIYSVIKEQGAISTSQIVNRLPPPVQKYLSEEGKEIPISSLFKRGFGGITKMFNTEPMCQVFRVINQELTIQVPTFEEAKAILLTHQEGSKRPHVVYPNPSGLPRNVYDAQHIRAFAKLIFVKLKDGMKLKVDSLYEQLDYPKYTDHHGDQEAYKKLIHFWFRSAQRFFTILPMAQIFTVHPSTGEISLKLRAPTLVQYKLDGYKVCERDQGPNQLQLARQRELEEQEQLSPNNE